MKYWEYKLYECHKFEEGNEKAIAKLGSDGWEMVNFVYRQGTYITYRFFFKREIPGPEYEE